MHLAATVLTTMAQGSAAGSAMRSFITPVMVTLVSLGSLVATFFLVNGGIQYMTSSGKPDKLDHAKKILRNALIGLILVIGAGVLTAILTHAYQSGSTANVEQLPNLTPIQPEPTNGGLVDVLVKAIVGLFRHIIESAAAPFINALDFFTQSTPLMAANSSVFKLWLATVAIADSLFVLVVALLGFHVMSAATLGIDEIEFKHLLPQLAAAFLLVNTSIFAIDAIISLSNGMISALLAGFPGTSVFKALSDVAKQAGGMGLVALMILVVFMILSVILLIYYVTRLVVLYIGAVLSPFVVLLWLLPSFKDFAAAATKTYLTTVFVLFVHVVILLLAASIFSGMAAANPDNKLDPIMATVVGVATILALLKTQGVLSQLSYVSIGPKAMRRLGSQFVNGVSYMSTTAKKVKAAATK